MTKTPGEVKKGDSDLVDGNHPNLTTKVTHEEIDTAIAHGQQTKRVKKILPPYHGPAHKPHNETEPIITIGNKRELGEMGKIEEPLRPAVVEELTVTEIRHADGSGDEPQSGEANAANNKQLQTSDEDEREKYDENEKHAFLNKISDNNVTEKHDSVSKNPIQDFNMQSTSHVSDRENGASHAISQSTSELDLTFDNVKDGTKSTNFGPELQEAQIEGIRLVPAEPHVLPAAPAHPRTMWDLIQDQHASESEEKMHDVNNAIYQEPKTLPYRERLKKKPRVEKFDTESGEIEYETENFQHGLSNIEKHELPFSYALPWLQVRDKESGLKENGKTDKKLEAKSEPQTARRFAAVTSNEELRIPADMSKLLRLSEVPELGENVALRVVESGAADTEPQGRTKWYLLLLTGNSTIVQRRRSDFTKYLRLNLAARLSVEYDDVKVNKLILAPPRVLVNVSVYAPSDDVAEESQLDLKEKLEEKGEGPLHKLAESNATLLELSGEEYRVVRFLSLQAPQITTQPVPQPAAQVQHDEPRLTSMSSRHEDIEYVIYTFLGSACACAVILTIFLAFNKYLKKWKEWDWPWKYGKLDRAQRLPEEVETRCPVPPAVIYSGGFPQIRGSWMGREGSSGPLEPPSNSASNASLLQRYPGIELGASQPASPRHNKLRMYNCRPDRVLIASCRTAALNRRPPPH